MTSALSFATPIFGIFQILSKKSSGQQLQFDVLKKFRLIYGTVRQHFREVERVCGVSGSQLWLLQQVARNPGIGISDLAQQLSIHQSTCSQLVEKLVLRKMLFKTRCADDQRRVALLVSDSVAALLARAPGPAEGVLPEALSALPDSALNALDDALSGLIERLPRRDDKMADKPLADL